MHILVFLAPAVIVYTAFMIYPLLDSLWLSLNNKAAAGQIFVGVENYLTLFRFEKWANPFWNALRNNTVFFVIHMVAVSYTHLTLPTICSV